MSPIWNVSPARNSSCASDRARGCPGGCIHPVDVEQTAVERYDDFPVTTIDHVHRQADFFSGTARVEHCHQMEERPAGRIHRRIEERSQAGAVFLIHIDLVPARFPADVGSLVSNAGLAHGSEG